MICASPEYLSRYGTPRSLDDLALHRCSVFRHPGTGKIFPWYVDVGGAIQTREFPPCSYERHRARNSGNTHWSGNWASVFAISRRAHPRRTAHSHPDRACGEPPPPICLL
ncbi:hypothetical protein [Caballeronia temeraria]|uniref:hypothetical protein n=1 Tax=Caballeronia temeraria TaxID=1777137 RepID=UPI0035B52B22